MDAWLTRIAARREEMVGLAAELVRIPTVNPPGAHYADCVELLAERLRRRGFAVEIRRARGAPGDSDRHPRVNLLARREGTRAGPTVHLNGHIDVVPAGEGWSVDPFAGTVRDGRLYGRGAADMKGGLAAAVVALETLVDHRPDFPGAVELSATVDEESGGFAGVAWLCREGVFAPGRVDHVIIPEPLDVDGVCIGHRGVWWAEVETLGRTAHGSMPFLGDSAILHMAAFLDRLARDLLPALDRRGTRMPVVPEAARRSTLNLNAIHGGQPETEGDGLPSPCVADRCRLVLDRRFPVEEDCQGVAGEIRALLDDLARTRPGFRYRLRELMRVDPVMVDADLPTPRAVARAVRRVLGREARLVCSPGTFDQKHIVRIAGLRDCIAYGPGRLAQAHRPDESVVVEEMVQAAAVLLLAVLDLLGAAGMHPR